MEDRRDVYRVFVERPEEGRSLGRGKLSSDDNTKVVLKEVRWGVNWIELAQYRDRRQAFVNVYTNFLAS